MSWEKIAIIGLGLLGGSLGLAIRKHGLSRRVEGYVRRSERIQECTERQVVDSAACDLASVVRDADLVVLCTPLAQMRGLVEAMIPALKPGAVVTDVGSVKESVVLELEEIVQNAGGHFVGSHPMAGGEKTGVKFARDNLFEGAVSVVTPTHRSHPAAVSAVQEFWCALGCRVVQLSPGLHDEFVSRTSHLPHVLAAALADFALDPKFPDDQRALCANGFKDTTRIASSSPEMWRDIALANRVHLGEAIRQTISHLQRFLEFLEIQDDEKLHEFFEQAKQRRDERYPTTAPASEGTE